MFPFASVRAPLTGALAALVLLGAASPATAEVVRHTLEGDWVAIHNLIGEFTVVPTKGTSVVAEITLRGRDAERLEVRQGALRGRTTLRVIYPGNRIVLPEPTSEGRSWKGWGHQWQSTFWVREDGTLDGKTGEGRRVTLSDRGSGIAAAADVRLLVPHGRSVAIYWGAGDRGRNRRRRGGGHRRRER